MLPDYFYGELAYEAGTLPFPGVCRLRLPVARGSAASGQRQTRTPCPPPAHSTGLFAALGGGLPSPKGPPPPAAAPSSPDYQPGPKAHLVGRRDPFGVARFPCGVGKNGIRGYNIYTHSGVPRGAPEGVGPRGGTQDSTEEGEGHAGCAPPGVCKAVIRGSGSYVHQKTDPRACRRPTGFMRAAKGRDGTYSRDGFCSLVCSLVGHYQVPQLVISSAH